MVNKNTGGSAFPVNEVKDRNDDIIQYAENGMTLRDYFAAKAMLIMWEAYDKGYCGINQSEFDNNDLAKGSYQIADAMLKARNE